METVRPRVLAGEPCLEMTSLRFLPTARRALFAVVFLTTVLAASETKRRFNLPAGDAAETLARFAEQADREIVFSPAAVRDVKTNAVTGEFAPREALDLLVARTSLVVTQDSTSGALAVRKGATVPNAGQAASTSQSGRRENTNGKSERPAADEPVMLSPFQVNNDREFGYIASSSLSGSRLNTSLRDTASQVAVFTPELIADLGANNLADVMQYAANYQPDLQDDEPAMSGAIYVGVASGQADTLFRIRNFVASRSVDFFESRIVNDNYNVERFEAISGPNGILFGFGSPGGVVNTTTKSANVSRTSATYRLQLGSWERFRNELDLNAVVADRKLAVRLMGMKESMESWRKWGFSDQERATAAVTFQPFARTRIRALREWGNSARHVENPTYSAFDGFALWAGRGRIVKNGFVAAVDRPNGINQITGTRHTWIGNNSSYLNAGGTLLSTFEDMSLPAAQRAGLTMLPEDFFPYDLSASGPHSKRSQTFHQSRFFIEHQFTPDLTAEVAFNRMWNYDSLLGPEQTLTVSADPNLALGSGTAVGPNPWAGRYYAEAQWIYDTLRYQMQNWRGTVAYKLDLGKVFGRHQLAGMVQVDRGSYQRRIHVEAIVDNNGIPISDPLPESAPNFLYRRNYFTEGDYLTYRPGDGIQPFSQVINGKTYTSRWVTRNQTANYREVQRNDIFMAATQSRFLGDRVVVSFGYRLDDYNARRYYPERVLAGDPRIASGERILNEWDVAATPTTFNERPISRNLGAVFHVAKSASLFWNQSSNVGEANRNSTLIPDSSVPRPVRGEGTDYGVKFELLDGRVNLRVNQYQTMSYDAIDGNGNFITVPATRILDTLRTRNIVTAAEYQAHLITGTSGVTDSSSRGTEVTLTANPTRHWSLQMNYSYNKQAMTNYYAEAGAAFLSEEAWWRERIRAAGLVPSAISTSGLTGSQGSIEDEISRVKIDLANRQVANALGFGSRPHKANVFTRYSFSGGKLRGLQIGGGLRYQSSSANQRDLATSTDYWGERIFQCDAMLGYKRPIGKLFGQRSLGLSVQLNVANVLDETKPLTGRLNDRFNGLRRVYFQEPRSFRLTTTVEY
jgi:outer membrane receptor protein involved in Fe transport